MSANEFSVDEVVKSLVAKLKKSDQEDNLLYEHDPDPEVRAISQFLTHPSELNRRNTIIAK